jgi:hypothetical protein
MMEPACVIVNLDEFLCEDEICHRSFRSRIRASDMICQITTCEEFFLGSDGVVTF